MSAYFRTRQYVILGDVIKTHCADEETDMDEMNLFVDSLVHAFANDNRLFIESLFRKGCGNKISQMCIVKKPKNRQLHNQLRKIEV